MKACLCTLLSSLVSSTPNLGSCETTIMNDTAKIIPVFRVRLGPGLGNISLHRSLFSRCYSF